jgi:hypothetical protein
MKIRYADGTSIEAVVLSQQGPFIRSAVQGCDDAVEFTAVNGTFFSEEGEPVQMEFAWERHATANIPTPVDCMCSKELALALIQAPLEQNPKPRLRTVRPRILAMGASAY